MKKLALMSICMLALVLGTGCGAKKDAAAESGSEVKTESSVQDESTEVETESEVKDQSEDTKTDSSASTSSSSESTSLEEEQETGSVVYETYTAAANLTKNDLEGGKGNWAYKGIKLVSEDCDWIDSSLNTKGSVNQGALYRKMAMYLEGFGMNDWTDYAERILGFMPASKDEFAGWVDILQTFIVLENQPKALMQKFGSLNSVSGEFDYEYKTFGKYSFEIADLTLCAQEMQISEEMLGYIFAFLDEYGATTEFNGNSCKFTYQSYM